MIHKSKVITAAARFIDDEFLGKLKGSGAYWILGAGLGIAMADAEKTVNALMNHPFAKFYNLTDGELIDVDRLYAQLHAMAEKSPATIDIKLLSRITGPITLTVADVEKLYRYIKEG